MRYQSLVVFIFLGILVLFYETRPEIGEELDLIAFKARAQLHFSSPSEKVVLVKLKKEASNVTSSIIDAFSKLNNKDFSASVFFVQAREINGLGPDLEKLFGTLLAKKNLFLGLVGSMNDDPIFRNAPAEILAQIRAAQTSREYNKDTIASVPLIDQLNGKPFSTIAPAIAMAVMEKSKSERLQERISLATADYLWSSAKFEEGNQEYNPKLPDLKINYFRPESWREVSLEALTNLDLSGKIVVFYFEAYRKRIPGGPEATYGNTPFQSSEQSSELGASGAPIAVIQANALENLLSEKALIPIPSIISWILLFFICLGANRVWSFSPGLAVIISLSVLLFILITTAWIESYFGWEVPIARTLVYGIIFSAIGAFSSTARVIASNLKSRIEIEAHANLSMVHERFLDKFSKRLMDLTSSILNSARLAKDEDKPENKELLQDLVSSGQELNDYLKNINTLANLEENSQVLTNFGFVKIVPILEKLASQIGADQKGISVDIDLGPNTVLKSDEVYLEPILFNLLSNAIKYSPPDSKITIFSYQKTDVVKSLVIRDQGPGIQDEFKEKIFEKFYRIKDDRAFTVKGTGLGLFLSKFFAEAIKLKIEVKDAPEKGTDFILRSSSR